MVAVTSVERSDFEYKELQRSIWSAANVLRAAGLNPLETVEHVSLMMLFRLAESAATGALGELRRLSPTLGRSALYAEVTSHNHPARFFNEEFSPTCAA